MWQRLVADPIGGGCVRGRVVADEPPYPRTPSPVEHEPVKRSQPPRRRTPLARGKAPLRRSAGLPRTGRGNTPRKGLRAVSVKRAAQFDRRAEVRAEVLARDRGCVPVRRGAPGPCWHPPGAELYVHEVVPRSRWKDGWLVPDNCIVTCDRHHQWIHNGDPSEARRLGLLSNEPPPTMVG